MSELTLVAPLLSAVVAAMVARLIVPPPRRLHDRVFPYVSPTLVNLARPAPIGVLRSVFGPMIQDLADLAGRFLDRGGPAVTLQRLRQAGWFQGVAEQDMVVAYRLQQLRALVLSLTVAVALGQLLGATAAIRLLLVVLAAVAGATRTRGRLDRAVAERRELMKIEIYTVNQLLAMRVRAGGGVIQAVKGIVERGSGGVIGELEEALRLHRAGWQGPDAFRRIAELTPEPFCARTYRLLATAEERGADLAGALLSLSEDVREARRESVKRLATKRRAGMLVPTVAILAPVLILFIAAPVPYLITSWQ